ncbi:unnamed protein product [Chilo suppressalis]|uniref:Protein krueppel n=1 Tax=Chilo suppressalis TaxID=168631 RepID=A0ABN8B573_CHISP|nr:hypothetical protein evm_003515 [Chilo suppressalis]CAH0403763.1 unnamed protein product [Chilo suppressalis]
MNNDLVLMKSVMRFLTGENECLCRLCLTLAKEHNVSFYDSVEIQRPYIQEIVTYKEILEDLGLHQENLLPQILCKSCATTIINTYIFKSLIRYCQEKWSDIITKIDNTLKPTKSISDSVKTIYFLVNENQNVMLTSRTTIKGKRKVLQKLKEVISYKKNYVRVKKNTTKTICEECGEIFKSKSLLSSHYDKVHSTIKYPCSFCPKVAKSKIQLEGHIVRMHYPKKFKCPKCDKMFSTDRLLTYHDKSHHRAVICKLCFIQFPSKLELRSHMDKHDVLNCRKCGKVFYSRQTIRSHEKICGNLEQKQAKFFCDICKKGYARKGGIRSHLKIDHGYGINMHNCKWCNKKFDAASKLKMHAVVHTRERNFHCEHCGNKFVTQAALKYHVRLHTGERPFQCKICGEQFVSASRRMEHTHRKHIGPTKECSICHVKFILDNQLKRHMRRHFNPQSKLYVCDK